MSVVSLILITSKEMENEMSEIKTLWAVGYAYEEAVAVFTSQEKGLAFKEKFDLDYCEQIELDPEEYPA
jgi:hypothetical protein